MNEEEMVDQEAPVVEEAPAEEMDPMENLMQVLGELQERYGIDQEEMDAVVDAINVAFGEGEAPAEGEEPAEETWTCPKCGMEVPASESVCPECGYSLENGEA